MNTKSLKKTEIYSTSCSSSKNTINQITKRNPFKKIKNLEQNLNRIKNLKNLFILSPKNTKQINSEINSNKLNIKTIRNNHLKSLSSTMNKFYHSFHSSSLANKSAKKKFKEKIICLELKNNKNIDNIFKIKSAVKNISDNKKEYENDYFKKFLYEKKNNLRKNKKNKFNDTSSPMSNSKNSISIDLFKKYENLVMKKEEEKDNMNSISISNYYNEEKKKNTNNKVQYYYFTDIINHLTRNINLVNNSSPVKELRLKLLRNLDNMINNKIGNNNYENYRDITINSYKNSKKVKENNNIEENNKIKNEKLFLSDSNIDIKNSYNDEDRIEEEKYYNNYAVDNNKTERINYGNTNFLNEKKTKTFQKKQAFSSSLSSSLLKKNIEEENFDKNKIIEDLKFLGTSNKLNWNLISEKDKKKGKLIWKKIINEVKDIAISCHLNDDSKISVEENKKINNINSNNNNISKSNNSLSSEDIKSKKNKKRQTIILAQKIKLDPIKINKKRSSIIINNIINNNKQIISENNNIINNEIKIKSNKNKFDINKGINKINYTKKISNYFNNNNNYSIKSRASFINNENRILNELKDKNNEKKRYKYQNKRKIRKKIIENSNDFKLSQNTDIDLDVIKEENDNNNENLNSKYKVIIIKSLDKKNDNIYIKENINNNEEIENNEDNKEKEENKEKENEENMENKENEEMNDEEEKNENIGELKEKNEDMDNINKEEEEKKKYEEEYVKYKQDLLIQRKNKNILFKRLHSKNSKLRKFIKFDYFKELKNSKNSEAPTKKLNQRKYFKNIDTSSVKEINKRKIEILLKLKHDLEFKIKNGNINYLEKLEYLDFEQKIYSIKLNDFNKKGIDEYLDLLEDYFNSFEYDIEIAETRKKDEERINGFRNNLINKINFSEILRDSREKKFSKGIDFSDVNHINELSYIY